MSPTQKLRVHNLSMSLDGYVAGPSQTLDNPLGVGGEQLHEWAVVTQSFQQTHGDAASGGEVGLDDEFIARGDVGVGATIMGRNMFGPVRGPWTDQSWKGWWGDNPPFHHSVFVLTHHPREPFPMDGGTTFYFVDAGIEAVLERAFDAADGADVRLGGGASTVQQYLRAGLIDELHVVIVPIVLGAGERLFEHLDGGPKGYQCAEFVSSPAVTHVRLVKG